MYRPEITLELKSFTSKYLADLYKLSDAVDCDVAVPLLDCIVKLMDKIYEETELHIEFLEGLSLVWDFNLTPDFSVSYVNYTAQEDTRIDRPCTKLFEVFMASSYRFEIANYVKAKEYIYTPYVQPKEDGSPVSVSPTFVMQLTGRLMVDAVYYERLQKQGASNKELFTFLLGSSYGGALFSHCEYTTDVYNFIKQI